MVLLTMSSAIVTAIEECRREDPSKLPELLSSSDPSLEGPAVGRPISHGQVIELSRYFRKLDGAEGEKYHLDDLLRGSKVYVEDPKPRAEPTPEYKALMERLRRQEEARAYERMVNPPLPLETFAQRFSASAHATAWSGSTAAAAEDEDEVTYADVNRQMALILNVVISILACSVALWMVTSHWSPPRRLALSMGGSGLVGVAEVVVYAGYLRRIKESKQKEKKGKETKVIIKSWVLDDEWKSSGARLRKTKAERQTLHGTTSGDG